MNPGHSRIAQRKPHVKARAAETSYISVREREKSLEFPVPWRIPTIDIGKKPTGHPRLLYPICKAQSRDATIAVHHTFGRHCESNCTATLPLMSLVIISRPGEQWNCATSGPISRRPQDVSAHSNASCSRKGQKSAPPLGSRSAVGDGQRCSTNMDATTAVSISEFLH